MHQGLRLSFSSLAQRIVTRQSDFTSQNKISLAIVSLICFTKRRGGGGGGGKVRHFLIRCVINLLKKSSTPVKVFHSTRYANCITNLQLKFQVDLSTIKHCNSRHARQKASERRSVQHFSIFLAKMASEGTKPTS